VVQYLPLLLILVLEVGFAAQLFLVPKMFGPSRSSAVKSGPYESGIVPTQPLATRFPVRFYLVAMIFIIFDIEVVFLYPWATIYVSLSTFGLIEMAAFVAVVFVSFSYLISVGALDWGPPKRRGRSQPMDVPLSPAATVRRVPRPDQVAEGQLRGEEVETVS
jgi:NADH-quinone oxidoreductase subunit A